jgi:CBS domain-containing protein
MKKQHGKERFEMIRITNGAVVFVETLEANMSSHKTTSPILSRKNLICLTPESSAADAARLMAEHHIGAIMVTERQVLKGIFTERDLTSRVIAAGLDPASTPLHHVMTVNPVAINPGMTASTVLDLMRHGHFRHVPVVEGGIVVGMVSMRDLFEIVRIDLESQLQEMEEFVFSSGYSVSTMSHSAQYGGWA